MAVTIKVNGVSNSLVHKASNGISTATLPDVCKTPSPGGPVPIPYPNVSFSRDLAKGTKTVKADGGNMIAIKGSEFSRSTGDEPGTVGGIKSSTFMKESTWITYSFDVKIDGKNACRLTDKKFQNHGNTVDAQGVIQIPVNVPPGRDPKCDEIWQAIYDLVYTVRPPTPPGGRPQGYKGLATRWQEYAENIGKFGRKPDGSLGKKAQGELGEYKKHQERLKKKLEEWDNNDCDNKGGPLPALAREYATQEPALGPGQPIQPVPSNAASSVSISGQDIATGIGIGVAVVGIVALCVLFPPAGVAAAAAGAAAVIVVAPPSGGVSGPSPGGA